MKRADRERVKEHCQQEASFSRRLYEHVTSRQRNNASHYKAHFPLRAITSQPSDSTDPYFPPSS